MHTPSALGLRIVLLSTALLSTSVVTSEDERARLGTPRMIRDFSRSVVSGEGRYVAYIGAVESFDHSNSAQAAGNSAALGRLELVEDDLHKHGVVVRGRTPVGDDIMAHGELGAEYRFDDEQLTCSVAGGLEWWISEVARLTADAAYSTGYFEGREGSVQPFSHSFSQSINFLAETSTCPPYTHVC